jgi:hypothetical protein
MMQPFLVMSRDFYTPYRRGANRPYGLDGARAMENSSENKAVPDALVSREACARHADGDVIVVRLTRPDEVAQLHALTVAEIGPSVATLETMHSVYKHNPECIWTILRRAQDDGQEQIVGYFGFLHLNTAGLKALDERTLSGREPNLAYVARAGERPAAIYVWAGIARKVRVLAEMLVAQALGAERYGALPIYATAGTLGGLKWLNHLGEADRGPAENALGNVFRIDTARAAAQRNSKPAA